MNEGYALRYLRKVMNWSFEVDNRETTWLRSISDFKFDTYRDFWAGSHFAEALLNWLQQFEQEDRQTAYELIRNQLIFVSFTEMQHLVNRTLPVFARSVIANRVAAKSGTPVYMIWSKKETRSLYEEMLKRTLFIGLSDGARIDGFRRSNAGVIVNDQVALSYEISNDKWRDILKDLRGRTKDQSATFEVLFLIDDFVGSGKTLLREEEGKWSGKLKKLAQSYICHKKMFAEDADVAVHHYIGTEQARDAIFESLTKAKAVNGPKLWFPNDLKVSFDLLIKGDETLRRGANAQIDHILDKYYDPSIETNSLKVGGSDAKFGFAGCGLPLILEHNTPNNSLALLWAESPVGASSSSHRMRPLFRRRQRHT